MQANQAEILFLSLLLSRIVLHIYFLRFHKYGCIFLNITLIKFLVLD